MTIIKKFPWAWVLSYLWLASGITSIQIRMPWIEDDEELKKHIIGIQWELIKLTELGQYPLYSR